MKALNILLLLILTSVSLNTYGAERTEIFRSFIWKFFKYPEFQAKRVQFPVERIRYVDKPMSFSPSFEKEQITQKDWVPIKGPSHFECESNCSDLLIYDNFDRKFRPSGQRVLSIEGVENGINSAYYFRLIDEKWFLVKIAWLDD